MNPFHKMLMIAVPLTHRNLTRTMQNIVNTYKLTPSDRSYLVMPLFHVHGLLAGFLAPLKSGGTVIIPPKFSAMTFWPEFTKYNATWYTAGPPLNLETNNQSPRSIRSFSVIHHLRRNPKFGLLEVVLLLLHLPLSIIWKRHLMLRCLRLMR
jgi:acyl-CoA synthetase (AMP-forming)/AMP-acid ligase II